MRSDLAARAAAGVGVAAAAALAGSRLVVLPGAWRGVLDPPSAARLGLAALLGAAVVAGATRLPAAVIRPLTVLLAALLPLVPVLTGLGLPLLAFQGPVVVLLACGALAVALQRMLAERGAAAGTVSPLWLCLAAFAYYAALAERIPGPAGPQGDEPQYLAMAHSLCSDGDLDLTDEFAQKQYAAFYPGRLEPHDSPNTRRGTHYSLHGPGVGLLIAPGYALLGFRGAQLVMAALVALGGVLVHRLIREAFGDGTAALAWAVFAFTPPVAFFAVSVYPESPALLGTAALLVAARDRPGWKPAFAAGLAAGALPWLHAKMLIPALAGLLLVLIRPQRWRDRLLGLAAFMLLLGALLALFARWYGRPSLSAAFGPPDLALTRLPLGLLGQLADRQYGLWVFGPVWALALLGFAEAWRRRPGDVMRAVLLAAPSVLLTAVFVMWWAGWSPPTRYLLPALPALAIGLAGATRVQPGQVAALGGVGLGLMGLAADAPRVLHGRPDGDSVLLRHLSPAFDLDVLLPSFVTGATAAGLLQAALLAALLAAAWRFGPRGAWAGAAALALSGTLVGEKPPIDLRSATLAVLERWQPARTWSPSGPLEARDLPVPLLLPGAPWALAAGESRRARPISLPPGRYRLEAVGQGSLVMEAFAADLPLGRAATPTLPLLLPLGVRFLTVAVSGDGRVDAVRVVPEVVVPADGRAGLAWPELPFPDRYRVARGPLRVSVLDRSAVDGERFRTGPQGGAFVLEGPPGAPVRVAVDAAATVETPAGQLTLDGPGRHDFVLAGPLDLGGLAVVPVAVRGAGVQVDFRPAY